ncbi:hypothetical protein [Streptomyces sp. NPDC051994]|uniref:hypothetical protein n=1 Tax=unclassified Streptomyces TaxID=2593676 RepID=UPI00341333E4
MDAARKPHRSCQNRSHALTNVTAPARIHTHAQQCSGAISVSSVSPADDSGATIIPTPHAIFPIPMNTRNGPR